MTGSPQPKRLKRSSSGIHEADGSTSPSPSASANQSPSSGGCDLTATTTPSVSLSRPSTSSSASSLSTFWHLPQEIKDRIFTLACNLPSADVANLALASPIFHTQANAALWSNIRITRPSTLTRLHDTVAARPELGHRVKNLHVGPEEEEPPLHEPHRWQGTTNDGRLLFISTSLRTAEEAQLLPRWCTPGQEWLAEPPNSECCRSTAVFKALQEVQRSLNVDLKGSKYFMHQRTLPRLFEAQAALDLYLMHMRRIEDTEPRTVSRRPDCSHDGNCHQYPPLLIIRTAIQPELPQSAPSDAGEPYVLTRQQILDHVDRRGSLQDKLDHPVIVARSGLDSRSLRAPGASPNRWRPDSRYEAANSSEFASRSDPGTLWDWVRGPQIQAFEAFSLREVLRKLLYLTTRLENLSLAGLVSYGCGTSGAPRGSLAPALTSLSVGPPPRLRQWSGDRLDFQKFKRLEWVHICGFIPPGEHVAKVGSLKCLREFRWTLTDDLAEEELFRVGVILDALTGRKGAAADSAAAKANENKRHNNLQPAVLKKLRAQKPRQAAQRKASRGSTSRDITPQNEDGEPAPSNLNFLPLIEVRLRPEALLTMMQRAATQEEREAWTTGTLWPGCNQTRRLLLTEVPAVRSVTSEGKPQHPLFEAAREWWEEHRAI